MARKGDLAGHRNESLGAFANENVPSVRESIRRFGLRIRHEAGSGRLTMKISQTSEELKQHFQEQLSFLRSSSLAYDQGNEAEAKRLASCIRTLVKESPYSLLRSIGIKDLIDYANVCGHDPQNGQPLVFSAVVMGFGPF